MIVMNSDNGDRYLAEQYGDSRLVIALPQRNKKKLTKVQLSVLLFVVAQLIGEEPGND